MRMLALAILPMTALAACSGNSPTAAAEASTRAEHIDPGQWEIVARVTDFRVTDSGKAQIDTPAGTQTSAALCLGDGDAAKPAPALFVGADYDCNYDNFYMRNGRLSAQMQCRKEGLTGNIGMTVSGTFTADSFEGKLDTVSYLASDGDVAIKSELTGRRTGDCQPAAEAQS